MKCFGQKYVIPFQNRWKFGVFVGSGRLFKMVLSGRGQNLVLVEAGTSLCARLLVLRCGSDLLGRVRWSFDSGRDLELVC